MSKRDIIRAAAKKGITFEVCEWGFDSTPGGMAVGWTIRPTNDCLERLELAGADTDCLYQDDFESAEEALDWVDAMPDIREAHP